MADDRDSCRFELTGGALCLDFANTLGDRPRGREERLASYEDLVAWSRQAESFPPIDLDELERHAREQPRAARRVFRHTIALRELLYRIFSRVARDESPLPQDLEELNANLPRVLRHLRLEPASSGFEWRWEGSAAELDRPLWPVVRSALELLTSGETSRIRECDSDVCSWLFIDRSRNQRRRWCDMSTCGNRAKARRHYRRRKSARVSS